MRVPVPKNWQAEDLTAPITDEATPPASSALLVSAVLWSEALAVTPYCGTGHQFDSLQAGAPETRHLGIVTPPASVHCRAALSRGWQGNGFTSTAAPYHEGSTSDGGLTGNDVVRVPCNMSLGYVSVGVFSGQNADIEVSGDTLNDAPSAPINRLFEVQTLGAPYVEPWRISKVAGFSVVPSDRLADLETL